MGARQSGSRDSRSRLLELPGSGSFLRQIDCGVLHHADCVMAASPETLGRLGHRAPQAAPLIPLGIVGVQRSSIIFCFALDGDEGIQPRSHHAQSARVLIIMANSATEDDLDAPLVHGVPRWHSCSTMGRARFAC